MFAARGGERGRAGRDGNGTEGGGKTLNPISRWNSRAAEIVAADRVLLATGGNKSSTGLVIASALGHAIEPPVPSLFTFNIAADPRLADLAGVSVERVEIAVRGTKLRGRWPLLVTHWGLSGPAILKLSAWGARELAADELCVHAHGQFCTRSHPETLTRELAAVREKNLPCSVLLSRSRQIPALRVTLAPAPRAPRWPAAASKASSRDACRRRPVVPKSLRHSGQRTPTS